MLRKRRKSGKKETSNDIPLIPGTKLSGKVSEPVIDYPVTEMVKDFGKFIQQNLPKSKRDKLSGIKQRHIRELLVNYDKLYLAFRAPIGVLDSFLQLIEGAQIDKKAPGKSLNNLSVLINSVQVELLNIENLLVYLLLVWAIDLPRSAINLLSAVDRELTYSSKSLKARKIKTQIDVDSSLGIKFPPELFGLCLRNVFSNIVDSAKSNTVLLVQTKLSHSRTQSRVDLSFIHPVVSETRIESGKTFDLFYSDKPSHLGIGLTLCRVILENVGGEISLESLPGNKMITTLRLPL